VCITDRVAIILLVKPPWWILRRLAAHEGGDKVEWGGQRRNGMEENAEMGWVVVGTEETV
jgi:hypothetical protein